MAYIRVRETGARVKGRPVRSYVVSWREPVRDEFGAVVPGKTVQRRIGHAPLFPGKRNRAGKAAAEVFDFDWAKTIVVDNLYHNYFQPACRALELGAVRFHDLRHTFATLALSAGEH